MIRACAASALVAAAAPICAAGPVFSDDFGTSTSKIDARKWEATEGRQMPCLDWWEARPNDAFATGSGGMQFVTIQTFGDAPVSAEFDLLLWNVVEDNGYSLFGFVTPDSIWQSNNAVAWRILRTEGKVYAMPYTTCHDGEVPGWHEHGGRLIEFATGPTARATLRIDWIPGVSAAFYLEGELKQTLKQEIVNAPMRFGTDVQTAIWGMDNVRITRMSAGG